MKQQMLGTCEKLKNENSQHNNATTASRDRLLKSEDSSELAA
jgi:hypothetical protein